MTPTAFSFKLTVPRDPALAAVVAGVAAHAVRYAEMDEAAGAAFVTEIAQASAAQLGSGDESQCVVVVVGAEGELRVTIGDRSLSRKISA